ncbi:peptide chain release factor 1 [Ferrovibrio xuzhouensis]|uniref:Peptide chain release factor 1 n=1 Tax=Ferrovibrio xuzhouensis TaxID=1576914 RepID=A0ABV7VFW9_9PROT
MEVVGLPEAKLDKVIERYEMLQAQMSAGGHGAEAFVKLSKEYAEIEPLVQAIQAWRRLRSEVADLLAMRDDRNADAEMRELAEVEWKQAQAALPELERQVKLMLLPKDEADEKNAILEVRAGTGGDEAALFARELFEMYRGYAAQQGWRFEVESIADTELGGFREAVATITGRNVFARLKFESGVHRVQRVPETEGSGRIHTSAATVAVLPEAEDVDIDINENDLRIDVYRSSGAGGQHVNTTDSAVRITHIPSGIVVAQQTERSQHKNKAKAMKLLRAKLYEAEREKRDSARSADRRGQVGSGDRSERIRTYNFPQGRVTDHRINLTLYKVEQVMTGEALDEIIGALIAEDQASRLAALNA